MTPHARKLQQMIPPFPLSAGMWGCRNQSALNTVSYGSYGLYFGGYCSVVVHFQILIPQPP